MSVVPQAGGTDVHAGLPADAVLAGPPIVELPDGAVVTLRDWLRHHHPSREQAWSGVAADFYRSATGNPTVSGDLAALSDVDKQLYFLALQMAVINDDGLTVGDVRRLRRQFVRRPVSIRTHRAVISALCGALARHGVPDPVILTIIAAGGPLRDALTVPPAPGPNGARHRA